MFISEKADAQKGEATCSESHNGSKVELGLKLTGRKQCSGCQWWGQGEGPSTGLPGLISHLWLHPLNTHPILQPFQARCSSLNSPSASEPLGVCTCCSHCLECPSQHEPQTNASSPFSGRLACPPQAMQTKPARPPPPNMAPASDCPRLACALLSLMSLARRAQSSPRAWAAAS